MVQLALIVVVLAAFWWIKRAYDDPAIVDRIETVSNARLREAKGYAKLVIRFNEKGGPVSDAAQAKLVILDDELRRRKGKAP